MNLRKIQKSFKVSASR